MAQNRKTRPDPTHSTPFPPAGQTVLKPAGPDELRGLNFLDTIEDFSDMVDFWQKCDQIAHGEPPIGSKESQKKCRFCS